MRAIEVRADAVARGRRAIFCEDGRPLSWREVAARWQCRSVIHTASPYVIDVEDPQRDLVDPAVNGTLSVLRSAAKAGVERVVLTSSMAAISDEPRDDQVFTEADWNEQSSLKRNPYYFSKAEAERAAWAFVEEEAPSFDLVVINPYMVLGPSLGPSLNTTNQLFRDVLTGVYPGIMSLSWGFVDVRDVARAHVLAMEERTRRAATSARARRWT